MSLRPPFVVALLLAGCAAVPASEERIELRAPPGVELVRAEVFDGVLAGEARIRRPLFLSRRRVELAVLDEGGQVVAVLPVELEVLAGSAARRHAEVRAVFRVPLP